MLCSILRNCIVHKGTDVNDAGDKVMIQLCKQIAAAASFEAIQNIKLCRDNTWGVEVSTRGSFCVRLFEFTSLNHVT